MMDFCQTPVGSWRWADKLLYFQGVMFRFLYFPLFQQNKTLRLSDYVACSLTSAFRKQRLRYSPPCRCPLHPPSKILSYVLSNEIYLGVLFFLNRLTKKLEERREEKRKEEEQVELILGIGSLCYLKEFLICCPIQQTQSDILRAQCCGGGNYLFSALSLYYLYTFQDLGYCLLLCLS